VGKRTWVKKTRKVQYTVGVLLERQGCWGVGGGTSLGETLKKTVNIHSVGAEKSGGVDGGREGRGQGTPPAYHWAEGGERGGDSGIVGTGTYLLERG